MVVGGTGRVPYHHYCQCHNNFNLVGTVFTGPIRKPNATSWFAFSYLLFYSSAVIVLVQSLRMCRRQMVISRVQLVLVPFYFTA
jgi:hypothetical protein